jgi:ataxia telangiectasia mutated family protein
MVDGLGISGIEGVFRRCCEETMAVLRSHHSSLMTILQVFLHDPLYQWTLSPLQALQKQQGRNQQQQQKQQQRQQKQQIHDTQPGNRDAHRALMRIKQKLQGFENGEVLGVEGHVAMLINEARDPNKLAKLYVGWSPWC